MYKAFLIMLLTLSSSVYAEWNLLIQTSDSSESVYINLDRLRVINEKSRHIEYWTKTIIDKDVEQDGLSVGDYYLSLFEVKCDSRLFALKSFHAFKKSGKSLYSDNNEYLSFKPLVPDTVTDATSDFWCDVVSNVLNQAQQEQTEQL